MAESVSVFPQEKEACYRELHRQLKALLEGESDVTAMLANTAALIQQAFSFHWVGFYLKTNEKELTLGPFQGPVACYRIPRGKGVCGACWETEEVQNVPDVHAFPGHIACSEYTKSELVVPIFVNNTFYGVLDIDSEHPAAFNTLDEAGMQGVAEILGSALWQ